MRRKRFLSNMASFLWRAFGAGRRRLALPFAQDKETQHVACSHVGAHAGRYRPAASDGFYLRSQIGCDGSEQPFGIPLNECLALSTLSHHSLSRAENILDPGGHTIWPDQHAHVACWYAMHLFPQGAQRGCQCCLVLFAQVLTVHRITSSSSAFSIFFHKK